MPEIIEIEENDRKEEDDEEEEQEPVTLGFVEKPKNPNSLLRQLFPSKAGGFPAWLNPIDLPPEKSRLCGFCEEPFQFLLQVYAPIPEKESTFHRTLYVFMCPSMACLLRDQHEQWKRQAGMQCRSVKVFRCQLQRSNPYYSSEPPRHDNTDKPSCDGATLCHWCGTWKGDKICSSCKIARYCSAKHQAVHWRSGHKVDCQRTSVSLASSVSMLSNNGTTSKEINKAASPALWPEFEIICEDESEFDTESSDNDNSAALVSKYNDEMNSIMEKFEGDDDKKAWTSFQQSIAKAPEQVLRKKFFQDVGEDKVLYRCTWQRELSSKTKPLILLQSWCCAIIRTMRTLLASMSKVLSSMYSRNVKAKPLWPMSSGQSSNADIPKCNYCKGPLCYEFQILPQLLYYLGVKNDVDSLDWATLVVYTCANSCDATISYKEEFAWVQISSFTSLP